VWVVVRVNMHEAKRQLSRLVDLAEGGEEIIIERSGRPVARLVACRAGDRSLKRSGYCEAGSS